MKGSKRNYLLAARSVAPVFMLVLAASLLGGWGSEVSVAAKSPDASGNSAPLIACPGGQCFADVLPSSPFYAFANRLYEQEIITGYPCGGDGEICDPENRPYYRPGSVVTRQQMSKFVDQARRIPGISITTSSHAMPIFASTALTDGTGIYAEANIGSLAYGLWGHSNTGYGVTGDGPTGVYGYSPITNGSGVYGRSAVDGYGVKGETRNGTGVAGISVEAGGWAGYFVGNVTVTGTCTGCLGPERIDHPLDPENKYLQHAAVESPDMMNVYNGNVILDAKGEAVVSMPDYFEAFNKDFRYQLTAIGSPGPNLYVAQEISNNTFRIAGGKAGMKVSWMVTGIRHDPYSEQHPVQVEVEKPQDEKGLYLHPTEWGQPESKNTNYEMMHTPSPSK